MKPWQRRILSHLGLGLSAIGSLSLGEQLTLKQPPPPPSKLLGTLDLRPSWITEKGTYRTENIAELGYQFTPNQLLSYVQEFYTNLYNPKVAGVNATAGLGFVRARLNRLYSDSQLGVHYELRAYLPTNQFSRDTGLISVLRNYFKFSRKFSDSFTFTAAELPVLHFYSKTGAMTANGPVANQVFENRIYLVADFNITRKLLFSMPLLFHLSRYANFHPDAPLNDRWGFFAWIYPELTYYLSAHHSVGVAYYSDNLSKPDFSGTSVGDGLRKGVVQFVYTAFL